jgi:hypothetical protein
MADLRTLTAIGGGTMTGTTDVRRFARFASRSQVIPKLGGNQACRFDASRRPERN